MERFDVIIAGAGAAGMMCAIEAGKRGRRVLLIDHAKFPGEKIRISGGGRCNFTNINAASIHHFLSNNPRFAISALQRYKPKDFIALVEKHGIAYHEKTLGQLFCDESSRDIVDMLRRECAEAGAEMRMLTGIVDVRKEAEGFAVETSDGKVLNSESFVVATGGPSIPKMGASRWGYEIADYFGLKLVPMRAALVPFTLDEETLARFSPLSGIATDSIAKFGKKEFREGMLFTHRGLSGPSVLQISSYWQEGQPVVLNLVPEVDVFAFLKEQKTANPKQDVLTIASTLRPRRLAERMCEEAGVTGRIADLPNAKLQKLADMFNRWTVTPNGTEGYRTAEVTLGGVDTDELSQQTMESHKVKGLYFIGEVVDVTGHLGGFNFQWAWASGFAAGQYA